MRDLPINVPDNTQLDWVRANAHTREHAGVVARAADAEPLPQWGDVDFSRFATRLKKFERTVSPRCDPVLRAHSPWSGCIYTARPAPWAVRIGQLAASLPSQVAATWRRSACQRDDECQFFHCLSLMGQLIIQ